MKTLDEVIEILERQIDKTRIKILDKDLLDSVPDALHYLKTIETTENLYHDAVNELSKWKEEDWKDRCLPLTWDELKTMEGKPVWTEDVIHDKGEWFLIHVVVDDDIWCVDKWASKERMNRDGYGRLWQAYRKEKE